MNEPLEFPAPVKTLFVPFSFTVHSTIEDDGEVQIHSAPLRSPLRLTLDGGRADAVRAISTKWSRLGLKLTVQANVVEVTAVPSCFLAREASCRQLTETLIEESLAQVLVYGRVSSCILPPSIRNVLNSIACRGKAVYTPRQNRCLLEIFTIPIYPNTDLIFRMLLFLSNLIIEFTFKR